MNTKKFIQYILPFLLLVYGCEQSNNVEKHDNLILKGF